MKYNNDTMRMFYLWYRFYDPSKKLLKDAGTTPMRVKYDIKYALSRGIDTGEECQAESLIMSYGWKTMKDFYDGRDERLNQFLEYVNSNLDELKDYSKKKNFISRLNYYKTLLSHKKSYMFTKLARREIRHKLGLIKIGKNKFKDKKKK